MSLKSNDNIEFGCFGHGRAFEVAPLETQEAISAAEER
jgi:hypothetical protein